MRSQRYGKRLDKTHVLYILHIHTKSSCYISKNTAHGDVQMTLTKNAKQNAECMNEPEQENFIALNPKAQRVLTESKRICFHIVFVVTATVFFVTSSLRPLEELPSRFSSNSASCILISSSISLSYDFFRCFFSLHYYFNTYMK